MNTRLFLGAIAPFFFLVSCGGGGSANTANLPNSSLASAYSQIAWEENFAESAPGAPNPAYWAMLTGNGQEYGISGWGNNERQYYLPANATVTDGALTVRGRSDASQSGKSCAGSPCAYTSARVTSLRRLDFSQPGFLEVKAQLPTGAGSWPAIWLLPGQSPGQVFPPTSEQLALQPTWPSGGEIDVVEWLGRYFTDAFTVQSTLHIPSGATAPFADQYIYKKAVLNSSISTNWHLYQLKWTRDQIDFAVDDAIVMSCTRVNLQCTPTDGSAGLTQTRWPFGTDYSDYHLLINLAIGGNLGGTAPATYDQSLRVAYVRYLKP